MIKSLRYFLIFFLLAVPAVADEWQVAQKAFAEGKFEDALALTTPLAEAGLVDAQNRLAHIYRYGDGTAIDYERALFWSRRAAEQGSGHAMFVLHVLHREGLGTAPDAAEAEHWLKAAAEHGEPLAFYNLYSGLMGEPQSAERDALALSYLTQAVDLGGADGQMALAKAYYFGELGLEQSNDRARELATLAAEQRNMDAFIFASGLVAHSELTDEVDYPLSALYLRAALRDGCVGVARQLLLLMVSMPLDDLLQSDRRLAEWLSSHPAPEPHRHRALPEMCAIAAPSTP